jgi:hypothetical protein
MSKILSVAGYPSFDLISRLPQDECLRRLRDLTDPARAVSNVYFMGLRIAGSEPVADPKAVVGRIGEVDLLLKKQITGFNSFQTCLFAYLLKEPNQTRLRCFVGVHPSVVAVGALMFLVVCYGAGGLVSRGDDAVSIISIFGLMYAAHGLWGSAAALLLFVAFAVFLAVYGRYSARGEREYLIKFLQDAIEARKV